MTHGARGTPEIDLRPLVFDQRGILLGWGERLLIAAPQVVCITSGVVVFAAKAISVAKGGKGHGGSTQITTAYQAVEGRQTVVGIVGTMMANGG
jgi:hypothetical protein